MALITLTGKPRIVGQTGTTINFSNFPDKEPAAEYHLEDETLWIDTLDGFTSAAEGIKRSRPRFRVIMVALNAQEAELIIQECERREVTFYPRTRAAGDDLNEPEVGFVCHVLNNVRETQHIKRGHPELTIDLEATKQILSIQPALSQGILATIDNSTISNDLEGFIATVDLAQYPSCSKIWEDIASGGGNIRVRSLIGKDLPFELGVDFHKENRTGRLFLRTDVLTSETPQVQILPVDMLVPALPAAFEINGKYKVWVSNAIALHLEEEPGTATVLDSTENQAVVTANNMEDADLVYARFAKGLQFDGVDESLTTPIDFPTGNFVVEVLCELSLSAPSATVHGVTSIDNPQIFGSQPMFRLRVNASDQWELRIADNTLAEGVVADSSTVTKGQLYHLVAAFYTKANGDRTVELFVDGVSKGTAVLAQPISGSTGDFLIGAEYSSGSATDFFEGDIDELYVYDGLPSTVAGLADWVSSRNRMYQSVPDLISLTETEPEEFEDLFATDPRVPWFPADMGNQIRSAAFGAIDGKVYIAGGLDETSTPLATLWIWDVAANTWSLGASMPAVRYNAFYGVIDRKLYVCGGWNGSAFQSTTYEYDPDTNMWATKTAMPAGRSNGMSAVLDGILYCIGGSTGSGVATNESYNPITDSWSTELSLPSARQFGAAVTANGMIFVSGGTQNFGSVFNDFYRFIPGNSFSQLTDMPAVRWVHAMFEHNSKVYVVGGRTSISTGTNQTSVFVYDQLTGWSTSSITLPEISKASLPAYGKIGNIGYLVGGEDDSGVERDQVEALMFSGATCPNSDEVRIKTPLPSGWYETTGGGPSPSTLNPAALPGAVRRGALCGVINDKIIAVGGENGGLYDFTYIYDPYANKWKQGPDYPTNCVLGGYGTFDGKFWVMAAYTGSTSTACRYYDPELNTWVSVQSANLVNNLGGGAWLDGKHYLHSGQNLNLQVYDPVTDQWTTLSAPPTTHLAPAIVGFENELYVLGDSPASNVFEKYNPSTDIWTTLNPFPVVTNGPQLFVYNDTLYCLHGNDASDPKEGLIYIYDKGLDSWSLSSFGAMPTPVVVPGIALHGDRVHFLGGLGNGVHHDEHQIYNFVDGWL